MMNHWLRETHFLVVVLVLYITVRPNVDHRVEWQGRIELEKEEKEKKIYIYIMSGYIVILNIK